MVLRFRVGLNWSAKCLFSVKLLLLVALVVLGFSRVDAALPSYVPDEELVRSPTIVIAKWEGSRIEPHHWIVNSFIKTAEYRTEIVVTRVIKGTLSLGKHTVLMGSFINSGDGSNVFAGNVQEGDATNLRGENLWFLESRRGWDASDRSTYPALDSFRGVQPIGFQPYYDALASRHRDEVVVKLLDSTTPSVVRRTLRYLAGGTLPWPYETANARPETFRTPLIGHAAKVEQLLNRKDLQIRRTAASVYAAMVNQAGIPVLRKLLNDDDAEIRAIAVGYLARLRDSVSVSRFADAMQGNGNHILICQIIDTLAQWKIEEAVPTLVSQLENDGKAYRYDTDANSLMIEQHTHMPAVRARLALHTMTGLWFPQDVDASLRAWEKVKAIADHKEREKQWKLLVPGVACPFKAKVESERDSRQIVVTNMTAQSVTLAAHPSQIEHLATVLRMVSAPNDNFVTFKPGESIHFDAECNCDGCWPNSHRLLIGYWDSGRNQGANAWVGAIEVSCKTIYKVPNGKIEKVVERWPDGKLRITGEMRDGVKVGKWTDYDVFGKPMYTHEIEEHHAGGCELQLFDKDAQQKAHEAEMSPIVPNE